LLWFVVVGQGKADSEPDSARSLGKASIAFSIIGIVLGILIAIVLIVLYVVVGVSVATTYSDAFSVCPSVCLSHFGIVFKRLNLSTFRILYCLQQIADAE